MTADSPSRRTLVRSLTLQSQFPLKHGETLDEGGVEMLSDDARPDERSQLGGRAALGIRVGELEDLGSLTGHGVLPDLTDFDRCEVWRRVRVGMRHANDHYHPDPFVE
jgi:hypothetical protein